MRNKLLILFMVLATIIIGVPAGSALAATGDRNIKEGKSKPQISVTIGQPRRRWRANGRWYDGYRNYGQFRRRQVGNRRSGYRMFPEYYWDHGVRRVRYVRYYYNF